jgi:hypothetical protein
LHHCIHVLGRYWAWLVIHGPTSISTLNNGISILPPNPFFRALYNFTKIFGQLLR